MSPALGASLRVLPALGLMLLNGVVLIWMLRKVLGHLHLRYGPTYRGPAGIFQTLLDVVKLLTKEDVTPVGVDRWLYVLAPAIVFVPSLMAYAPLPFSPTWVMADLELGLLFMFAILSLVPIGIMAAGWASGSKWSLLGGMRAVGQQIAYEVPLLLAALPVALMAGSLRLSDIVAMQGGSWLGFLPRWYVFVQPVAWLLFFVAALVELNQTPFDMSEAESELVAGFATEYSSMKFGLLFLAEFSNLFVMSALMVTLFFGGWQAFGAVAGPVVFIIKTYVGIFVMMWIRGTFPRVRVDQLQDLGWKVLLPVSLAWLLVTGVVIKALEAVPR